MTVTRYHKTPTSIHSLLNPEPSSSKRPNLRVKTTTEGVPNSNNNGRPKRKRITPDQFRTLSDFFNQTDTPNHDLRDKISKLLNMTNREVQVWFQNRRAKANRIKLQEQQKRQQDYFHKGIILYNHNNYISSDQPLFSSPPQSPPSLRPTSLCDSPTSTIIDSPITHYPDLPLHMSPIDILATAAEYVQRCDQEKHQQQQQQQQYSSPSSASYSLPSPTSSTSWRPWI
ncbi:unnamed protein product [Absidia cylindrospora]